MLRYVVLQDCPKKLRKAVRKFSLIGEMWSFIMVYDKL